MSLVDFAAGCLGGVANVVVGHPFDTVKVRFQQSNSTHRRTLRCFTSIVQQETVRGLYKGVTSPLYSLAAINAILFGVQGNMLRKMHDPNALSSHFAAGVMAGFLQCGISCPMELAKIKLQVQGEGLKYGSLKNADYTGSIDCLTKVYNLEGLRGVCRGMASTILRDAPAFGFYFLTYEYVCRKMAKDQEEESPTRTLLLAGGLAGCVSWISTYPADVIKTRMQEDGVIQKGRLAYRFNGYSDCIRAATISDGYGVYFRGLNATLLRAFPTNAATFAVVGLSLRHLNPYVTKD